MTKSQNDAVSQQVRNQPLEKERSVGLGRFSGMTWAHFLNDGAANYVPGVLPALLVSLDEPVKVAGVLIAALTIGQAVQPLTGWLADKIGGRILLILGLLASSLGGAFIGMATNIWVLVALLLITGLGTATFHPQALASIRTMVRSRQGFLVSAFLVGGELGRGVWPTLASLLGVHFGLRSLWVIAIPALITTPFLWRWAPKLTPRPKGASIHWGEHLKPIALLISYRSARSFSTNALVTFVPVMWFLRGGSLVAGASIITTYIVGGVIGNLSGGNLADRIGRRPLLIASALAGAVLFAPIAYVPGYMIWITSAVLGFGMFLTASTTVLIGQDIFPENRAMGSGLAQGLSRGIGSVLIMIIGFLVSKNDVSIVFWIMSAASLASVLPAIALPDRLLH